MTQSLNAQKLGLALGCLLGLIHLIWSLLVAINLAQPVMDFVFQLHMIEPPYSIQPFSLALATGLVLVTFLSGYALGYAFALLWNYVAKK